jgi:hypothetical protein
MRGAQQGPFIGFAGRHLGDNFPPEQDDRPIANQADFRKLGRKQQYSRSSVGHLTQQPIDLMLGADIDAAGWIKAKQRLKSGGDPSRDRNFLLIAAAQSSQFRSRAGVDLQALDRRVDALALASDADQTPLRDIAYERQGDVLKDRALRQKRQEPIRWNKDKAFVDRIAGVIERELSAAGHDLSAVVAAYARNTIE